MSVILESDILDAYINNEIGEYDVIDLYMEGYISDNTMDLLIDEDDYISEAALNISYEMEALEEGRITRGLRALGHNIAQANRNVMLRYHQSTALRHLLSGNLDKSAKYSKKAEAVSNKIENARRNYLKKQKDDAGKSGHIQDFDKFKKELDEHNMKTAKVIDLGLTKKNK